MTYGVIGNNVYCYTYPNGRKTLRLVATCATRHIAVLLMLNLNTI
jgi:hypothetical protein